MGLRIMNYEKLKNVAGVSGGIPKSYFSKEQGGEPSEYLLLPGVAAQKDGDIDELALTSVYGKSNKNLSRYVLSSGDVVLTAKGASTRASYVSEQLAARNIVPSANFIIIRANKDKLHGEVLVAFLNSELGQAKLQLIKTGAVIANISLSSLKEIEVPLPSKDEQSHILKLYNVGKRAYKATLLLAEQQRTVVDAQISNLLVGDK